MPKILAVAGKGGSGKTTLSALLVRALLDKQCKPVLAVDADPNTNLGEGLGINVDATLGSTVEQFFGDRTKVPPGMTKEALLEMRFASIIDERKGFDLLSMGRGEGPGCYCSINNTLRMLMDRLTGSYKVVMIDNEAGLEHLSRRTTRKLDALLIVSDFAVRGLRAARGISELIDELELDVAHRMLVVSRAPADDAKREEALKKLLDAAGGIDLELAGVIPQDEGIVQADLEQTSVFDLDAENPAVLAAIAVLDKVLEKTGIC